MILPTGARCRSRRRRQKKKKQKEGRKNNPDIILVPISQVWEERDIFSFLIFERKMASRPSVGCVLYCAHSSKAQQLVPWCAVLILVLGGGNLVLGLPLEGKSLSSVEVLASNLVG